MKRLVLTAAVVCVVACTASPASQPHPESDSRVIDLAAAKSSAPPTDTGAPPTWRADPPLGAPSFDRCVAEVREGAFDPPDAAAHTPPEESGLFFDARRAEQSKDLDRARKGYFELIQSLPKSRFVPYAYLAFGELFFDEASSDPTKFEFANQSYQEVLKHELPPEVRAFTSLRLAQVEQKRGDPTKALDLVRRAFSAIPSASTDCQRHLRNAARVPLLELFAEVGEARKAKGFFLGLAREDAPGLLSDLGDMYITRNAPSDAGHAWRAAIELDGGLCPRALAITAERKSVPAVREVARVVDEVCARR